MSIAAEYDPTPEVSDAARNAEIVGDWLIDALTPHYEPSVVVWTWPERVGSRLVCRHEFHISDFAATGEGGMDVVIHCEGLTRDAIERDLLFHWGDGIDQLLRMQRLINGGQA